MCVDPLAKVQRRRAGTYSETTGEVPGHGPLPAPVETEAFIGDDFQDAATTESFWVRLAFDLQDVQGQEDDFSDTDQRTGECVHHCFAIALAEGCVE